MDAHAAGPARPPCKKKKIAVNTKSTPRPIWRWSARRAFVAAKKVIATFHSTSTITGQAAASVKPPPSDSETSSPTSAIQRREMTNQSAV